MRLKTKVYLGLLIFAAAIILSRPLVDLLGQFHRLPGNNPDDELSRERERIMLSDKLVALLDLQAGSTVLDLGAGFGMYTFRLARAVGPSGKVFATDIDDKAVNFLAERARREGASNVEPVLVTGRGPDPFYHKHVFDLIFASDVVTEIDNAEAFFDALRPSLREGTGRLWVISVRLDPDFTPVEFENPGSLRRALTAGAAQTFIVPRLSAASQRALAADEAPSGSEAFMSAVLDDLNRLLGDRTLWPEMLSKRWPLSDQDDNLRSVLSEMLDKQGVFTTQAELGNETRRFLRMLNRILILNLLDNRQWSRAVAFNKMSKAQLIPLLTPPAFETSWGRPSFLENAGYEVVREHTSLPYWSVWEYQRRR